MTPQDHAAAIRAAADALNQALARAARHGIGATIETSIEATSDPVPTHQVRVAPFQRL
jgi:hypothetical protein